MTKNTFPKGIEVLLKKASVDMEFRKILIKDRSKSALEIGLELIPSEKDMIDSIPEKQLVTMIYNTTVPINQKAAFRGKVAAVMLAAIGVAFIGALSLSSMGHRVKDIFVECDCFFLESAIRMHDMDQEEPIVCVKNSSEDIMIYFEVLKKKGYLDRSLHDLDTRKYHYTVKRNKENELVVESKRIEKK